MLISTLLSCAWEFFQVGLFAVGGGLATIPFLEEISLRHTDWFTQEELVNFVAISESTPGPIGINIATYAGYKIAGPLGSLVCTFFLILPSFLIILIIAKMLARFKESKMVEGAFYGIRPASTALILSATITTFFSVLVTVNDETFKSIDNAVSAVNLENVVLFAVILAGVIFFKKLHPIVFIAIGAVAGIILGL